MRRVSKGLAPWLVALGALLWSTDALFRVPAVQTVAPETLVLGEHLLALVVLVPLAFLRQRAALFRLSPREWLSAVVIGAGGSAAATVLFTNAFRYADPAVVILLQKVQPLFVITLAFAFLGEKPVRGFWIWAPVALASAFLLSFPDPLESLRRPTLASQGAFFALAAAALWAVSTVAGKTLLHRLPADAATFWRFVFGALALTVMNMASGHGPSELWGPPGLLPALLYMAFVPGLIAMLAYYSGLGSTPAAVATLVELVYPLSAVILSALFLGSHLEPIRWMAALGLIFSVTRIAMARAPGR